MWTEDIGEPVQLQAVRAHKSEVTCVDVHGAWLVSGSGDRSLRLWRWECGRGWDEVARAGDAHRYGVTAARWAASGVLLASGGVDGAARVWSGRCLAARRLLAAPGATAARALAWAGAGRLLVGHDDGALCVWHVPRAHLLARLHAHEGALQAVTAPARGALLLTACTHGVLKLFDLSEVCRSGTDAQVSPDPLQWIDNVHDLGALCADVTEDGSVAATGGQDSLIHVWRILVERRRPVAVSQARPLRGHTAAVTALRWAGHGPRALLASASLDRSARLWVADGPSMRCAHVLHAHARYLTCVALAYDMSSMVTGSNDKTFRMWSLGSLTIEDRLDVPCAALHHFALGDLEGIEAAAVDVDDDPAKEAGGEAEQSAAAAAEPAEGSGARRLWHAAVHAGALNDVATHGDLLATASSDGLVRVFHCSGSGALEELHALAAHQYPVTAVDFGAAGAVLLTAGLDGRASLWDVQTGVRLRSLSAPAGGAGDEAGGGGVRGARCCPRPAPLLLLATDDGLAPLWSAADASPRPLHVFAGHAGAATCCAWSADGRLAACGDSAGELRLYAPPPRACLLHHERAAHDHASGGGVQSCDFAPAGAAGALQLAGEAHVLATGGGDEFLRLWRVQLAPPGVRRAAARAAHGGGVSHVRWGAGAPPAGAGALLASAGGDGAVRVWRAADAGAALRLLVAVPQEGGVLAAALLGAARLACGSLSGELSVWQLPPLDGAEDGPGMEEGVSPCLWNGEGVARWIQEYITRVPGNEMSREEEERLIQISLDINLTGFKLLFTSIDALLEDIGYEAGASRVDSRGDVETRLCAEIEWLQHRPVPYAVEQRAPHALLCPLSHRLLREPAAAADGYTYERANILDWFIAADGAVSPLSGRRLRNARLQLNRGVLARVRDFLVS